MLPHKSTFELKKALEKRPEDTFRRIAEIYNKVGSLDATARRLNVPVRTFSRIVARYPELKEFLNIEAKKSRIVNSYKKS